MKPHLQGIEIKPVECGNHDFTVKHAAVSQGAEKRIVQLGKVPIERSQIAALNEDLTRAAKDNRPKPVPLRFVEEGVANRKLRSGLRKHRLDRRRNDKGARGHALA